MPIIINDYLKAELNELARIFYAAMGYEVEEGFDFTQSQHPQELLCYYIASESYDFWSDRLNDGE